MREPDFWYRPPGWQSYFLNPLGALYSFATARRVARPPSHRASVPVICIGNINAGGTGKTPMTIALIEHLTERGHTPFVVSRGYGGSVRGPTRVDPTQNRADEVGDEPLLLAAFAPTIVAQDRAAGAKLAEDRGANVIVLDDGHQNPGLYKDLSLITVDAARGFGNTEVIPAGPLREPVEVGLRRADMLISIGAPAAQTRFLDRWPNLELPHLRGSLEPLRTGMQWQGLPTVAFAGIGQPEKFFTTLRELGVDLKGTEALDDHQPISTTLFDRLLNEAKAKNAQLVTTEKDAARLSQQQLSHVLTLPVRLRLSDWAPVDEALERLAL